MGPGEPAGVRPFEPARMRPFEPARVRRPVRGRASRRVLMAATERGVCFAQFGASEAALRRLRLCAALCGGSPADCRAMSAACQKRIRRGAAYPPYEAGA